MFEDLPVGVRGEVPRVAGLHRVGARAVMSIGTIIVSAGLLALSQVRDPASWLAVWVVIGAPVAL